MCDKASSNKSNFTKHIKNIHSSVINQLNKKGMCIVCDEIFIHSNDVLNYKNDCCK